MNPRSRPFILKSRTIWSRIRAPAKPMPYFDIDVPEGGAEGMIVTEGGRFVGYGLYLLRGKPVFAYNLLDLKRTRWEGPDTPAPGKHTIVYEARSTS
jgi:hypothetical protein